MDTLFAKYKELIKEDVVSLSGNELVQPICDSVENMNNITTEDVESIIDEWDNTNIFEEDIEIDDNLN